MVSVKFGPVLQVVRCGSEKLYLGLIRYRGCSPLLFETQRIISLTWTTTMRNKHVYGTVVCCSHFT